MDQLVVDASVAVKWFLAEDHSDAAMRIRKRRWNLHAPAFFLIEFGHVLCKKARRHEISASDGIVFLEALQRLPIRRHADEVLFPRAFAMGMQMLLGLYDCIYLALALELDCPFVTADRRFLGAVAESEYAAHAMWIGDLPSD